MAAQSQSVGVCKTAEECGAKFEASDGKAPKGIADGHAYCTDGAGFVVDAKAPYHPDEEKALTDRMAGLTMSTSSGTEGGRDWGNKKDGLLTWGQWRFLMAGFEKSR